MSTWTRTWESQEHGSAGCFLAKGAVFWVGGSSLMSTTTLTLRHRAQLFSKILEEGAHGETFQHTFTFASTFAGDIHHAIHSLRGQMHDWRCRDLRSIRALQTELEYKVCNIRKKEGESSAVFGQRRTHLSRGAQVLVGTTEWEEAGRQEMHKRAGLVVRHCTSLLCSRHFLVRYLLNGDINAGNNKEAEEYARSLREARRADQALLLALAVGTRF